jgi:hypothetical protein
VTGVSFVQFDGIGVLDPTMRAWLGRPPDLFPNPARFLGERLRSWTRADSLALEPVE